MRVLGHPAHFALGQTGVTQFGRGKNNGRSKLRPYAGSRFS